MNPDRLRKMTEAAIEAAKSSKGTGSANFRVGAVLTNKKGIIKSKGYNSYKTHTFFTKFYKYPFHHAEGACILNCGLDNIHSSDVICVARVSKTNIVRLAKPCSECQELLRYTGIRKVVYSTNEGTFEELFLDEIEQDTEAA